MTRIELVTSPLPRECSTTELHGQTRWNTLTCTDVPPSKTTACRIPGAGEGNRTLVVSLEGFCSTIELHPRIRALLCKTNRFPGMKTPRQPNLPPSPVPSCSHFWWRGKDSNLRRQSRQIYSLIPLTAREPLRTKPRIIDKNRRPVKPLQAGKRSPKRPERGLARASRVQIAGLG